MGSNNHRARILVVEDDPSILLGLRMNLEGVGYDVGVAEDGDTGLARAREGGWDLIVLDVMLPGMNGHELLAALRAAQDATPVIMLTARGAETDKIVGLDLGADDYVTKPFSLGELLARVRVILRRGRDTHDTDAAEATWGFGEIVVRPATREVMRSGVPVELTQTEFDVLTALFGANGRILSRRQIMDAVWGPSHHGTERSVDNFVAQLRAKLEVDPASPEHLITVRGAGYRLVR